MSLVPYVKSGDEAGLRRAIQGLNKKLGAESSPTFAEATITGLTGDAVVYADADKKLTSVSIGSGISFTGGTLAADASGIDHGGLMGLTDDDHTGYWMAGVLRAGDFITSGTVQTKRILAGGI